MSRRLHLAHEWQLEVLEGTPSSLLRGFIRPAVRAVPPEMARQIGCCQISLPAAIRGSSVASEWTASETAVRITIARGDLAEHEIAMELLLCLGQVLWETLTSEQQKAYWRLLDSELLARVDGEIDEDALREKRALLASRISATSSRRLKRYGRASFAGTAAEYVHSLWHEVKVVSGPEHLPVPQLRRRFDLLASWFPPGRGYQLYSAPRRSRGHKPQSS